MNVILRYGNWLESLNAKRYVACSEPVIIIVIRVTSVTSRPTTNFH